MSEKKRFPAGAACWLLAGTIGVLVTAGCLSGMAVLMASRKFSGTAAAPLAMIAVGAGSFCGGWSAAFFQKQKGLACGTCQGILFAALLLVLSLPSDAFMENAALLRFAVCVLCGSIGGFLGVRCCGRKRIG